MNNINKNVYIILILMAGGFIFSCGGNLKDPMKAPELQDRDLEVFLNNFPLRYGPTERTENIREIFYSGGLVDGMRILTPRLLGEENNIIHYAIIIEKESSHGENTILYFEKRFSGDRYTIIFTRLEQGEITRYQYTMNPIMLNLFSSDYFKHVAEDIAIYQESEPEREAERKKRMEEAAASFRTPEGWPKDSIYTSLLLLREGILDFKDYRVGDVFYTGNRKDGITVDKPRSSGKFQIITVNSVVDRSTSRFNIYLRYDSKSQMSLLEKIEIKEGNGSTTVANTFEEKYTVLMILLPVLMNEGNIGN